MHPRNSLSHLAPPLLRRMAFCVVLVEGFGILSGNEMPLCFTSILISPSADKDPVAIVAGEFNRDNRPDLAVANRTADNVTIFLGDGNGGFSAASSFGVGREPASITAADFNLDGALDLATANERGGVTILLGDGSGSFSNKGQDFSCGQPVAIVASDFNLDGRPDLATANKNDSTVTVLLGDGTGRFDIVSAKPRVGGLPVSIVASDFNRDGIPDLAIANSRSRLGFADVTILLGNGAGGFTAPTGPDEGLSPVAVLAADFNLDGNPDLALAHRNGMTIFLGDGTGLFDSGGNAPAGNFPIALATGDFNLDGNPDLATANLGSEDVTVTLGDGQEFFAFPTRIRVGPLPESIIVGDFNLDGRPDLATAQSLFSPSSFDVTVLLNGCPGILTKTASPDPVTPGADITYTITVSNSEGSKGINDVVVTDDLPSTVSLISAASTKGQCVLTSPVRCDLGTLGPGAAAEVTILGRVGETNADTIRNTVTLEGQGLSVLRAATETSIVRGPVLPSNAVVNAASFLPFGSPAHPTAPGSIVSIFGENFVASISSANAIPLPTVLEGVSVTFDEIPAPLFFVSPEQINAQLPAALQGDSALVVVRNTVGASEPQRIQIHTFGVCTFLPATPYLVVG